MTQTVVKNVGGPLVYLIPQDGRPASATVALKKPDGTALQAATAAIVDTVSTTLDGACAVGATTVPLTATTGVVVGRTYLMTNAVGQAERVTVTSITTGVSVEIEAGAQYIYASGAAFVGLRLTYTATATHAATLGRNYRAVWTYTVGGVQYTPDTLFHVVARQLPDILTVDRLRVLEPGRARELDQFIDQRGRDYAREIGAVVSQVNADIESGGWEPHALMDAEALERLYARAVVLHLARQGVFPTYIERPQALEYIDRLGREVDELRRTVLSRITWYDDDGDLAMDSAEEDKPLLVQLRR